MIRHTPAPISWFQIMSKVVTHAIASEMVDVTLHSQFDYLSGQRQSNYKYGPVRLFRDDAMSSGFIISGLECGHC